MLPESNHFTIFEKMKQIDRKTEIINCAAKLFKEKGYSAVTMRDIAQALDIKAASLYNHIKSKQEILVLIVIEIAEEFTNTINEIVLSETTTIQKLEKVIQLHIDITIRNPEAIACLNNDWMHLTDEELTYFVKMREDYEESFRDIIKSGITSTLNFPLGAIISTKSPFFKFSFIKEENKPPGIFFTATCHLFSIGEEHNEYERRISSPSIIVFKVKCCP